ncbi:hypothetical protein Q4493_11410 [Colwellia sp. 1_MG-2023]|uniref:hypothetical protein n=1 Tax=Colwellia sp. 1_MG-2023 TaxID=3062649 RepID=UPI0026E48A32|nr:hypothetical protein [Colwellia sp. 1_MG-2023]MDO6446381.1 hypothetical protein [Colwellia sp. 1_MG-2023]
MNKPSPTKLLKIANSLMLITALITALAVYFVYGIEEKLTMMQLIGGHITIMVMPALFKLSYVLRLISLRSVGIAE